MTQVFPMIPASGKALWFLATIGLVRVGMLGLFGSIALSSRQVHFEVSPTGLRITGPYGRSIPAGSLLVERAAPVDLKESREYGPTMRTNGIGLPGYGAGWFRLRNGEKALLFLTDASSVVYLPTTEGYSLLLSVAEPESFLGHLSSALPDH